MKLNVGQLLKKNIIPARWKHFFLNFADILASASSFFRLAETEFSLNTSSQIVYTDFGLISNPVLLFRDFFSAAGSIAEIRCKPVFFDSFSS